VRCAGAGAFCLAGWGFFGKGVQCCSPTHHWLLCGYFLSIVLEKSARDGKSTKAQHLKTGGIADTIDNID
jgi:hypothetical protein